MRETVYSLATVDAPMINSIRDLTAEEFQDIAHKIDRLEGFYLEDALYNLIELNYQDLNSRIGYYLNQYIENPKLDFSEFSSQYLDLNRLILNVLSSIRTYLDHTETRLNRTFGNKSEEYKLFKLLTSEAFDSHFAYRFLSKLRNYSQHCGLPVGSICMKDGKQGFKLELILLRDHLLGNFKSWGAIVKPELLNQEEEFDILSLLEQKVFLLNQVNQKISAVLLEKLSTQGSQLLSLIVETQEKGKGIPCLLKVGGAIDNPQMEMKWFPYSVISKLTGIKLNVKYTGE